MPVVLAYALDRFLKRTLESEVADRTLKRQQALFGLHSNGLG